MLDMYNPALGAHYLASPSQVRVLEKYGWLPYSDWLATQNTAPAPAPAPVPAPVEEPVTETTPIDDVAETVPAPTL